MKTRVVSPRPPRTRGDNFKGFRPESGLDCPVSAEITRILSYVCQIRKKMALAVLHVPNSLDSGGGWAPEERERKTWVQTSTPHAREQLQMN